MKVDTVSVYVHRVGSSFRGVRVSTTLRCRFMSPSLLGFFFFFCSFISVSLVSGVIGDLVGGWRCYMAEGPVACDASYWVCAVIDTVEI